MNFLKYFRNRYNILISALILIYIIMIAQIANLQLVNGVDYDRQAQERLLCERDIPAPRGKIIDRNGVIIAADKVCFNIQISKSNLTANQLNKQILNLVNIFEKNNDFYVNSINKYIVINPISYGPSISSSIPLQQKWKSDISGNMANSITTPLATFSYLRDKFKIGKEYSVEDAYKIMHVRYEIMIKGWSSVNTVRIATDVKKETIAEIADRSIEFPDVTIEETPQRYYVDGEFAPHVIGYLGNIDVTEYNIRKTKGYKLNDLIGKSGIEASCENYLRGIVGQRIVKMDSTQYETNKIVETPAKQGNDIMLTIDMQLQKIAQESLARNIDNIKKRANYRDNFGDACAGAAVALDINTGEVLAMISYPGFSPNIYVAGPQDKESQKIKNQLLLDKIGTPLLNRTIQGTYTPGSTYKPITAIAGLEEGIITPSTTIVDNGTVNIGGWTFYCLEYKKYHWAHGSLTLERALATSCNIFFHELGNRVGIDKLDKWAKLFGLGERTGIDIPSEEKGIRANKETKRKLRKDDWRPADTAQSAIGQFDNVFTPLQLANYVATIANNGKHLKPFVIKKVIENNGTVKQETIPSYENIKIDSQSLQAVKKGMVSVANSSDGTAVQVFGNFPFKVAGKTGTAELGSESTHSSNALFVCYAPADDPKIAVCVVIEHGVWGSNAAPVAADILRGYFDK